MASVAAPARVTWPAVVPAAVRDLLRGPDRHGIVLGVHDTAVYVGLGEHDEVVGVVTSDGLALPIALRLGFTAREVATVGWGVVPGDHVLVGEGGVMLPRADVVAAREQRLHVSIDPLRPAGGPPPSVLSALATVLGAEASPAWVPRAHGLAAAALADDDLVGCLVRLVGLGRGLTPAGDDVVCGVTLTLRATGQGDALGALAVALRPLLHRTTALSAALLRVACDGRAVPAVERLVDELAAGRVDPAVLAEVAGIGHSSGRDLLAGVVGACLALADHAVAVRG